MTRETDRLAITTEDRQHRKNGKGVKTGREHEITLIYKRGFPLDTPEEDAIKAAEKEAKKIKAGDVIDSEVFRDDAHTNNGEYMVHVRISGDDTPEEKAKDKQK